MATTTATAEPPTTKKRKMEDSEGDSGAGAAATATATTGALLAATSTEAAAAVVDAASKQRDTSARAPSPKPHEPSSVVPSSGTAPGPKPSAAIMKTFHRRVLPDECVAFSSPEGRALFTAALSSDKSSNYMQIYFPLAEQFTTQAEPAFCGLATLAMCLNALQIDPGRIWKGPWRWFSEELLDCCTPLETAKAQGISFDQFVCLAQCNGAHAHGVRADASLSLDAFRAMVKQSCASSDEIVVLNYTRKALAQTGDGHFSPIGGYSAAHDMVLLLDVARFKYPPHWVRLPLVFEAIQRVDASSGRPRGAIVLTANRAMASTVTPANRVIQARMLAQAGATGHSATVVDGRAGGGDDDGARAQQPTCCSVKCCDARGSGADAPTH